MVFSGKDLVKTLVLVLVKNIGIFCFLRPNVYHATNMHFKSCNLKRSTLRKLKTHEENLLQLQ